MEIQNIRDLLKDHNKILIDTQINLLIQIIMYHLVIINAQPEHRKYLKKYMIKQQKINIKMLFFCWIFQDWLNIITTFIYHYQKQKIFQFIQHMFISWKTLTTHVVSVLMNLKPVEKLLIVSLTMKMNYVMYVLKQKIRGLITNFVTFAILEHVFVV